MERRLPYPSLQTGPGVSRRQLLGAALGAAYALIERPSFAAEPIAVVMSGPSVQSSLSLDKLRRVFLAKPTDDDAGASFVPINHAQSSQVRDHFDRRVLGLDPDEAARYWIDQRLRGKKPPRVAASIEVVRRAVSELPGAISYLPLGAVGSLHVVLIDGLRPSDPAYPLH
jgi:ABC-type phosphate transport system substrate-binding protein